ncbi:hypothetical protein K435DRAFT_797232 [Dendrothele bispora CBS 962.96]|uniref:Zn(2)-C6 fungal-type domain-containing protein n=1 Tax=Dendrothele bispora (strain CBS 962.96) TaxID=1314807 RepID=A0A4S8M3Q5_DENBC|nr:hypothetical protein K435DRAFT_797232 [Dendrothele bispora CBS 962.96]
MGKQKDHLDPYPPLRLEPSRANTNYVRITPINSDGNWLDFNFLAKNVALFNSLSLQQQRKGSRSSASCIAYSGAAGSGDQSSTILELEEAPTPPNASRQEQYQIKWRNMETFEAFVQAETAWETRNSEYEAGMEDVETRMAEWVDEWKAEFQKDREERKEKEAEEKRKEAERKRAERLAEADRIQEQQQVAGSSGTRSRTPPVPDVEIREKRKAQPSHQAKICERCITHKLRCRPQEKGRTLACQACREAKARCSLTELARKRFKSAPEVQDDNDDANYVLNLFTGELAAKVHEMDKKIDKNKTTAFWQYAALEEQNYRIIGLLKVLLAAAGAEIPEDLQTDSEDGEEEDDVAMGGPEGFFDDEALEVNDEEVRKEEKRAGAESDESSSEEEESEDDK